MDFEDMISISAESRNKTESDIPGPGRLLGKVYAKLGQKLETVLNLGASSTGRGPATIANEIQRLAWTLKHQDRYLNCRTSSETRLAVKKLEKKLKEACRVLVKYTRYFSNGVYPRTGPQSDFDLSSNRNEDILALLRSMDAAQIIRDQELYVWDYCDPSLRVSSRAALSCLSNDDVYSAVQKYSFGSMPGEALLTNFLRRNPEKTFIALRMLSHAIERFYFRCLENTLVELLDFAESSPEMVEWDEVDKIFGAWVDSILDGFSVSDKAGRILEGLLRYEDKLPKTMSAPFDKWLAQLQKPKKKCIAHRLLNAYYDHTSSSVSGLSEAYDKILHYLNRADITLAQIDWHRLDQWNFDATYLHEHAQVQCLALAQCLTSPDFALCQRALACIRPILEHDIYLRRTMEQAPSTTDADHRSCCTELLDQTESVCRPKRKVWPTRLFTRHLDEQGRLVHSGLGKCRLDACVAEEWMEVHDVDFLLVRVHPGEKFMREGLYSIIAGYTPNGQPTYCADLDYQARNGQESIDSYVTEGMTPADALVHNRVEDAIMPEKAVLGVYVLRYAPETYPRRWGPDDFMSGKDDGIDATGPYSWKPAGRLVFEGDGDEVHELLVDPISGRIIMRDGDYIY